MNKYTPGPWRQGFHGKILGTVAGMKNTIIAICHELPWNGNDAATYEMEEANARLIAAAPDLLEALSNLLNCIDGPHGYEWLARCKKGALNAIAKAEGEHHD